MRTQSTLSVSPYRIMIAIIIGMSLCIYAFASSQNSIKVDKVVSVYDGDTIKVIVDDMPFWLDTISVRINGYDTPEIRGKCATEKELAYMARDHLRMLVQTADEVYLDNYKKGKYFRLIADVYVVIGNKAYNVKDSLIDLGLARAYDGGKRESWCD